MMFRRYAVGTIAGLPSSVAIMYALLFLLALWCYTTWWKQAPMMQSDSWSYIIAAADIADPAVNYLQTRPPGYPLLLLLTGSNPSPSRALLLTSLLLHGVAVWLL
jgi:hypothetical protein